MRRFLGSAIALFLGLSACGDDGLNHNANQNDNQNHQAGECGDGMIMGEELCDGADLGGEDCTTVSPDLAGGTLACNATCDGWDTSGCTPAAVCGDGVATGAEVCDGSDLRGDDCTSLGLGFTGGHLACEAGCLALDTSGCTSAPEACGDGTREGAELCDGVDLGGADCTTIPGGFTGGALACAATCDGWDTTACTTCGDGVAEAGEVCEGADLKGQTCASLGYGGGTLGCRPTCDGFEVAGCTSPPECGNGMQEPGEVCDGADLAGQTCATVPGGFTGGALACAGTCDGWDTSACTTCGDGILQEGEVCELGVLQGMTCASLGFAGGALACQPDCLDFDVGGCTGGAAVCGNGAQEPGELCDGTDLAGHGCASVPGGFTAGPLGCAAGCGAWDTSACTTCGNGLREDGEVCDGASLGGASCTGLGYAAGALACAPDCHGYDLSGCTGGTSVCGNGIQEPGEVCDGGDLAGHGCASVPGGFTGGVLACAAGCGGWVTAACTTCGNGVREPGEVCDGASLGGETCVSQGFGAGDLACSPDCHGYDVSACTGAAVCGNGIQEPGEVCDGADLAGFGCTTVPGGFTGGTLACNATCDGWVTAHCATCGNGLVEPGESCDGANLAGRTCLNVPGGYTGGSLTCNAACDGWSTAGCTTCGNAHAETGEVCDGIDLRGETCTTIPGGFIGGSLACAASCGGWDTSGCSSCGNGTLDPGEVCDGAALGATTCQSLGFGGGTLGCRADCQGFDVLACTGGAPVCGNGVQEAGEACDGSNLVGRSCADFGFASGQLACAGDCADFVTTGCLDLPGTCGDGVIDVLEDCDGANLQGRTCADLGFAGGTLACSPRCFYDLSGCGGDLCEQYGAYGDGYCDPCAQRYNGHADPDCELCAADDGVCVSYLDWALGGSTCRVTTGHEDPDCGSCGDGVKSDAEACDGVDLGGLTCAALGFAGGTLACTPGCGLDTSACQASTCGDGIATGSETCDGADLRGNTCGTIGQGFNQGTLQCRADCAGWLTSGCGVGCASLDLGTWAGADIVRSGSTCAAGSSVYDALGTGTSCTGYATAGREVVYRLGLPAGATVHLTYTAGSDGALYVLGSCTDLVGATCVAGSDTNYNPPFSEGLDLHNAGATTATYYVVLDNYFQGDCSAYTLTVH